MLNKVVLPPIMLPFLRDAAVTFWNYAFAKCNININKVKVEQGLEVVEIEGDICNCLTGELKKYWSSKGRGVYNCNASVLDRLSNGNYKIDQDNIKLELGKLKGSRSNFSLQLLLREMNEIIQDYLLYSYCRGFLVLNNRTFKKDKKIKVSKGTIQDFYRWI